jgi:hypothetical protein
MGKTMSEISEMVIDDVYKSLAVNGLKLEIKNQSRKPEKTKTRKKIREKDVSCFRVFLIKNKIRHNSTA